MILLFRTVNALLLGLLGILVFAAIEAAGSDGVSVVLQGKLDGAKLIEAGIVATSKTPKPAADEAVAT